MQNLRSTMNVEFTLKKCGYTFKNHEHVNALVCLDTNWKVTYR